MFSLHLDHYTQLDHVIYLVMQNSNKHLWHSFIYSTNDKRQDLSALGNVLAIHRVSRAMVCGVFSQMNYCRVQRAGQTQWSRRLGVNPATWHPDTRNLEQSAVRRPTFLAVSSARIPTPPTASGNWLANPLHAHQRNKDIEYVTTMAEKIKKKLCSQKEAFWSPRHAYLAKVAAMIPTAPSAAARAAASQSNQSTQSGWVSANASMCPRIT